MDEFYQKTFRDFIAPNVDRFDFLNSLLFKSGLAPKTVTLAGGRHLFVSPVQAISRRGKNLTVLIAHYDRAEGSPGANDNSAAVFQLIEVATKLRAEGAEDWLIIFTDKEELKTSGSFQDQGSYTLAMGLRDIGLSEARFYIFDACGCGDFLILSSTVDRMLDNNSKKSSRILKDSLHRLRTYALDMAGYSLINKVLVAPTPFSDDAGFLFAGIAAQTITMLPGKEASAFASNLRKNQMLADAMIKKELWDIIQKKDIPETWLYLNSPGDSHLRLTPKYYPIIVRFAVALCQS